MEVMNRRKFLTVCVACLITAGILFSSIPFVTSLQPNSSSQIVVDVDLTKIAAGESKMIVVDGKPITIYKASPEDAKYLISLNEVTNGPDYSYDSLPEYFVYVALSTHRGCGLEFREAYGYKGLMDICHRGFWDKSGRLIPSVHAGEGLKNLEVFKNYVTLTNTKLRFSQ